MYGSSTCITEADSSGNESLILQITHFCYSDFMSRTENTSPLCRTRYFKRPKSWSRRAQDILILCLFHREDHRSLERRYISTSQPDMDILWTLSICEAVALPAICAVLKSIAKQEGQSLPRWGQLLRGVFLSQIAAFAVVSLLSIHERALLLLCIAIGSWVVTSLVLRHPRFDRHGFPHPETSDQVNLDVEQEHQSQSSGSIDWVSNFPWSHG